MLPLYYYNLNSIDKPLKNPTENDEERKGSAEINTIFGSNSYNYVYLFLCVCVCLFISYGTSHWYTVLIYFNAWHMKIGKHF